MACTYHNREDCKACKSLNLAIKAEGYGKTAMTETLLDKAVKYEQAGE